MGISSNEIKPTLTGFYISVSNKALYQFIITHVIPAYFCSFRGLIFLRNNKCLDRIRQ